MSNEKQTSAEQGRALGREKSRKLLEEHQEKLNSIEPVITVKDMAHCRTPEVLNYCRQFLLEGGRWDELRRKLGLGPAHIDKRWRLIRELVPELIAPVSEQDALTRLMANQLYMMNEVEALIKDADTAWQASHYDKKVKGPDGEQLKDEHGNLVTVRVPGKESHNYLKMKLDGLKLKFEQNAKEFQAFMETKKLKAAEKKTNGVSIIVNYTRQVARPGDNKKEEKEVIDIG